MRKPVAGLALLAWSLALAVCGAWAQGRLAPWVEADAFADVRQAVAAAAGGTLHIRGPVAAEDVTIANCALRFDHGGMLVWAHTPPRIDAAIEAGAYRIFNGPGPVRGQPRAAAMLPEWCGAVGDGTHDDTAAIQQALDSGWDLVFTAPAYAVTHVEFSGNSRTYRFVRSALRGIAKRPTDSVMSVRNARHNTFYDVRVDQRFNTNYTAALHWWSVPQAKEGPSQYTVFYGLRIVNATIGLLYGDLESRQPPRNTMSENTVYSLICRGVETPIYFNQPNGFLFVSESVIDAFRGEWPHATRPDFEREARCIKLLYGNLRIHGGQITKCQSSQGLGIESYGNLSIDGAYIEIASDVIRLGNKPALEKWLPQSMLRLSGVDLLQLNDRKAIETAPGSSGVIQIANSQFKRAAPLTKSMTPVVATNGASGWSIIFNGSVFLNYNRSNILSASVPPTAPNAFDGTFLGSASRVGSDADGWISLDQGGAEPGGKPRQVPAVAP